MFALFNINNLSNKGNTLKNQQASLIKDPEYLHLFSYVSVYTDHIVHVKSAAEGTTEGGGDAETSHSVKERIYRTQTED